MPVPADVGAAEVEDVLGEGEADADQPGVHDAVEDPVDDPAPEPQQQQDEQALGGLLGDRRDDRRRTSVSGVPQDGLVERPAGPARPRSRPARPSRTPSPGDGPARARSGRARGSTRSPGPRAARRAPRRWRGRPGAFDSSRTRHMTPAPTSIASETSTVKSVLPRRRGRRSSPGGTVAGRPTARAGPPARVPRLIAASLSPLTAHPGTAAPDAVPWPVRDASRTPADVVSERRRAEHGPETAACPPSPTTSACPRPTPRSCARAGATASSTCRDSRSPTGPPSGGRRLAEAVPRRAAGRAGRRVQGPRRTTPTTGSGPTPRTST